MKIIAGNSHPELAQAIAQSIDVKLTDTTVTSFPDGETFVKINENIRGQDVFIIQSTCPPTNHNLMEMLIMVDAARRASAGRIIAVMPFFGYARQDRKDQSRVPITAKLVANLITSAGVDRVITVDLHAAQIQGFFDIPVDHLYASSVTIPEIKSRIGLENLVVVSPDVGGVKIARKIAHALGVDFAIVAKHRVNAEQVEAMQIIGTVADKNILIVDDMTETAGTLCAAADILKAQGANDIYAHVSHGIISDIAEERINQSPIKKLLVTNSVPQAKGHKIETLSIAPLLGESILRIYKGESVTSLFDIF